MAVGLKITDSDAEIKGRATRAMLVTLDAAVRLAVPAIRRRLGEACDVLIEATPEYASLLGGELLGELGIPEVDSRVRSVLRGVRDGISVVATPLKAPKGRISGGLTIGILRRDFEDLLSLPAASYISAPSGEEIRWLDWLLVQGDRIVVAGYDAFFDLSAPERDRSRTKLALMRRGHGWRVPPEFAGTESSNFLSRAFDVAAAEALIATIVREEIERRT